MPNFTAPPSAGTPGDSTTPHAYYVFPGMTPVALGTGYAPLDLSAAVEAFVLPGAVATLDLDPESDTYLRIVNPSGRTFIVRIGLRGTVTAPEEPGEAADYQQLGLALGVTLSRRDAREMARKKRGEGEAAKAPQVMLAVDIDGTIDEVSEDMRTFGLGEGNVFLYVSPGFSGETWRANGGQIVGGIRPNPAHVASGVPAVTYTVTDIGLFNVNGVGVAETSTDAL